MRNASRMENVVNVEWRIGACNTVFYAREWV